MRTKAGYHHGDLPAALLQAAEIELSKKGIRAFSMRAVAKRAGVSHGASAHHFGDVKGLLTALAAKGFHLFVETQERRQRAAAPDPESQLAASGLGYVDFAVANPELFQLMFSSEKPDKTNKALSTAANAAFDKLVHDIERIVKSDPYTDPIAMTSVMATWATAHGLANLMIGGRTGRMKYLLDMKKADQDHVLSDILLRASSVKEP